MKTCKINNCNEKHYAYGLCRNHYNRIYRAKYNEQYYQKHKESRAKYLKQYYQNNKEKRAKYDKQYCKEHKSQRKQYLIINKKRITKRNRQYNEAHKEQQRRWREDNKEAIAKGMKEWFQENKEKIREQQKQWSQTPTGKASTKARNIRQRTQDPDFTNEIILRLYEANLKKYGVLTCYLCGEPIIDNDDSIDHSTPTSRGGGNEYKNLGIAHQHCNAEKFTMTLDEWFKFKSDVS